MDAIVLAGGKGTRLGGVDKAALVVAGRSFLERALDAVAAAERIVVVGERRDTVRMVTWTREEPAGTGPVAAIAAGLLLTQGDHVAVIAVDLPFLRPHDLDELLAAAEGCDGAIFVDADGRDQPLAGVYRNSALRAALAHLPGPEDVSVRALVAGLDLARVSNERASRDCDTQADLLMAEEALKGR